jgi:hypothetical protein
MHNTRINIYRLSMGVLVSLVFPFLLVMLFDLYFGWMPLLPSIASIILIPISSFFVIRAVVAEFERVIQVVAPQISENDRE